MAKYTQGDKIEWDWGKGTGTGTVEKTYTRKVTRKLQGSEVTRNGSDVINDSANNTGIMWIGLLRSRKPSLPVL